MHPRTSRRGLSTARAALHVTWLLGARPEGVRADDVAGELGKSVSTAYNLLASLCAEGVAEHHRGGLYRLTPGFRDVVATGAAHAAEVRDLSGVVSDLLARTHKRSYVGIVRQGEVRIVHERGQQGMPKLPGLHDHAARSAHALALGKVVLALGPSEDAESYLQSGLRAFTVRTITEPVAVQAELQAIREDGFADDIEEFDDDFCGIAAPIFAGEARLVGSVGISMSRRAFEDEHDDLVGTVLDVARSALSSTAAARFQAYAETRAVLDSSGHPRLAWANGDPVP
ncbi:MAG: acetyl-CoA synthetase [Solirubrobacteraceae bacterium]|nr:acetyl-CoA synthetase [Solirubrobacteraceae bacterium]